MSLNHNAVEVNGIQHIDRLYGYAMILTRNHTEAEDLVQEAYLRAIPVMNRLLPESNLKVWLFTILRNVWLNHVRKQRTGPPIIDTDVEGGVPDGTVESIKNPHNVIANKMEIEQVRAAVQRLPVDFREIILLREYEDLSYCEIAHILDCPMGIAMSRLGRARSKLRLLLSATLQRPEAN